MKKKKRERKEKKNNRKKRKNSSFREIKKRYQFSPVNSINRRLRARNENFHTYYEHDRQALVCHGRVGTGATASVMIIQLFYTIILALKFEDSANNRARKWIRAGMSRRERIFHIIRLKFHRCRLSMHPLKLVASRMQRVYIRRPNNTMKLDAAAHAKCNNF